MDDLLKLTNGKVISGCHPQAAGLIAASNDAAFLTQF